MGNDFFDPKKDINIDLGQSMSRGSDSGFQETAAAIKTSLTMGRALGAWFLKRRLAKEGYDPYTIDAACNAVKAGQDPELIIQRALEDAEVRRKQAELKRNPPPIHGSARWSKQEELRSKGLNHANTGRSLSFGKNNGEPVTWDGESHLLTVAPTRTGKGTMQIIPNLLQYMGASVVLDPKGELYEATSQWRRKNVGPVYVLNPFGLPISNKGKTVPTDHSGLFTHAFNPLDTVTDNLTATKLAEMVFPRNPDEKQAFFDSEAIGLLSGVIEFFALYGKGEQRTMGNIRDKLSSVSRELYDLLDVMSHPAMPHSIRNAAKNFLGKSKDTGKPRVMDSLNQHLRLWDNKGLRTATAKTDFDFKDLKDTPATVYLILPFDEIQAYSTYVRMVIAMALNAMLENKNRPDIPVLFVLDEFLALDPDDRFVSALRTHAGYGVRLWFFLQDLPTLEQKYPKTWKSFLQVETQCYFGTGDINTAKLISETLGNTTVAYESPNASASTSGGANASASYSISENITLTGRNLMTPDEVVSYMVGSSDERAGVLFLRDIGRATQITLNPYYNIDKLKERCT